MYKIIAKSHTAKSKISDVLDFFLYSNLNLENTPNTCQSPINYLSDLTFPDSSLILDQQQSTFPYFNTETTHHELQSLLPNINFLNPKEENKYPNQPNQTRIPRNVSHRKIGKKKERSLSNYKLELNKKLTKEDLEESRKNIGKPGFNFLAILSRYQYPKNLWKI